MRCKSNEYCFLLPTLATDSHILSKCALSVARFVSRHCLVLVGIGRIFLRPRRPSRYCASFSTTFTSFACAWGKWHYVWFWPTLVFFQRRRAQEKAAGLDVILGRSGGRLQEDEATKVGYASIWVAITDVSLALLFWNAIYDPTGKAVLTYALLHEKSDGNLIFTVFYLPLMPFDKGRWGIVQLNSNTKRGLWW